MAKFYSILTKIIFGLGIAGCIYALIEKLPLLYVLISFISLVLYLLPGLAISDLTKQLESSRESIRSLRQQINRLSTESTNNNSATTNSDIPPKEGEKICKKCGTRNLISATFCKDCGEYF